LAAGFTLAAFLLVSTAASKAFRNSWIDQSVTIDESMKRFHLLFCALLPALVCAQSVPYTKFTLDNGMTFILHEDHSAPKVVVNTYFRVGSKDEPARRSGFAHLFEHLMFMGTHRVPRGQFDAIMEAGGGDNNANTETDRTDYYDVGPSNLLPTFLWLEADRLQDLGNAIDQTKLNLQREVVLNERRETENSPYGNASIKLPELMYPEGHPYHFDTIGLPEDLNAATVQDVKNFFATYYVPNNATMAIAGDFDTAKTKALIQKYFGGLPRKNDPVHRTAPQPENPAAELRAEAGAGAGTGNDPHPQPLPPLPAKGIGQKWEGAQTTRLTMVDQVQYPQITMAWHSPAAYQPGDAEMDLTAYTLSNGISSRLYQKLVYQDKIATDVSASQNSLMLGSEFLVTVTAQNGVPLDRVENETREVLSDFVKSGPTQEELQRQIAQIETANLNGLQSIENIAYAMNAYDYYFNEPDSFQRDLDRYRNATTTSVQQVAASVIGKEPRVVLTVVPQTPENLDALKTKPPIGNPAAWTPPAPTTFTLSNGLKVEYWQRSALPLMSMSMVLQHGSDRDLPGKAGTADLLTEMLDKGAGGKNAMEFSNALDRIGASFGASASVEDTTISVSSTQEHFADALSLYADALLRPNFDPAEWDRQKQLHVSDLQQALDEPATVGRRIAAIEYFGPNHPYGHPVTGTLNSVASITLDDVKQMFDRYYQPQYAVAFGAGSMSADEFKSELEHALGSWKQKSSAQNTPMTQLPRKPLRVYIVDKPGAVQTVVRFIMPAPTGHDPHRIELGAIGSLLGGTFTSRLNANLREAKGYTYGASAGYALEPSVGYFVAGADVRTNVTGASLREFLKEFASIRTGNITQEEVTKTKASMRTEVVDATTTLQGLVETAIAMHEIGLPYSQLGRDLQTISALTPAQLNALAKQSISLENAVLVLVGDKAQILAQYKGLGLPQPVVVKAE